MVGGLGDDIYFVDNALDQAIELSGEGTDLVVTSVDFTLGENIENLQLANATNTSGTGNEPRQCHYRQCRRQPPLRHGRRRTRCLAMPATM